MMFYTDNPALDADRYTAHMEELEDAYTHAYCDNCGGLCDKGDLVTWMGDELVCPRCYDELQRELFGMEDD